MKSEIVLSAHQPNFLPYLGFFDKMLQSDIFVIRDEVLYIKKEYHNRNRIRINSHDNLKDPQSKWISVPVIDPKDYIMHAKIKKNAKQKNKFWNESLLHEIEVSYHNAPYFKKFFPELEKILHNLDESLLFLNIKIIKFFNEVFEIKTKIILASELGLKPKNYQKSDASEDIAKICNVLKATTYLSGAGGRSYLNLEPFEKRAIKVEFQDYEHPIYKQHLPGFLPFMAAIDALFCVGKMPEIEENIIQVGANIN